MNGIPVLSSRFFRYSLLIVLIGAAGCTPAAPAAPTAAAPAPTRTSIPATPTAAVPLPTPTRTETPILPTRTAEPAINPAFGLVELLHYAPGAGGAGDCPGVAAEELPAAVIMAMPVFKINRQLRLLCVYGFPEGEMVNIAWIDPSGWAEAETRYQVLETIDSLWDGSPMTAIAIQFDPNLAFQPGEWRIRASASSGSVETSFELGVCPPPEENQPRADDPYFYQAVHKLSVQSVLFPLSTMLDSRSFAPYTVGDTIEVRGACYPPNTQLPVGIYRSKEFSQGNSFELLSTVAITTDPLGAFAMELELAPELMSEGAGGYFAIIPVTDAMRSVLEAEHADLSSVPFAGFELLPLPDQQACYAETRFTTGDMAAAASLVLFDNPYYLPQPLAEITPGEPVELLDGPVCSTGQVWWYVHGLEWGLAGWADQEGLEP